MRTLLCIRDLRNAVVNAIKAAQISGIGDNVFPARTEKAWPEESNFALVYTPESRFDDQRSQPVAYKSETTVYVDVVAQRNDENVADTLDELTNAVVVALLPTVTRPGPFDAIVRRFVLTAIDNNLSSCGEMDRGLSRITFRAEYSVNMPTTAPTDEFLRANTTLSAGDGTGNEQTFTIPMRE